MKTLDQILQAKLDSMQVPVTGNSSKLGTIMIVLQDQLNLNMYDLQAMEDVILDMSMYMTDKEVLKYLEVSARDLARLLAPLKTDEEWVDTLLMDVLWEAMLDNLDNFPVQTKISPTLGI